MLYTPFLQESLQLVSSVWPQIIHVPNCISFFFRDSYHFFSRSVCDEACLPWPDFSCPFNNRKRLHMSQVTHRDRAYPNFCSMKWLEIFLLTPSWDDLGQHRVTPSIYLFGTHLDTWVERVTVRAKCLVHEQNTMSWPGFKPGLLHPESRMLTIKPLCLHLSNNAYYQ